MKAKLTLVTGLAFAVSAGFAQRPHHDAGGAVHLKVKATGTGNTTGHIATLSVANSSADPVKIATQTFYIPSGGAYQSYVGRTPDGIIVSPGETIIVPVNGYCTDVHTPPVPGGEPMPPLDTWIPVAPDSGGDPPPAGTTGAPVPLIPVDPVPPFDPGDIPSITGSPAFTPGKTPHDGIVVTWPGTDTPLGGALDPAEDPVVYAQVIVTAWEAIEGAAGTILQDDDFMTPFSGDPEREHQAVVQQTIWLYGSRTTGREYDQDDFGSKVYEQFESTSGMAVGKLPEEHKDVLDEGIASFWNTFTAVGVEAKVLSSGTQAQIFPKLEKKDAQPSAPGTPGQQADDSAREPRGDTGTPGDDLQDPGPMAPAVNTACLCDSLTFRIVVRRENANDNNRSKVLTEAQTISLKSDKTTKQVSTGDWRQGDYFVISLLDAEMACHCQNAGAGNAGCDFYAATVNVNERGRVLLDKAIDKVGEVENLKDKKSGNRIEKASKKDADFKFKFTPRFNPANPGKVEVTFCFSATCASKDCSQVKNEADCGPYCVTFDFIR